MSNRRPSVQRSRRIGRTSEAKAAGKGVRMADARDLVFFVTVAEELHFARAAARLHIVPATVTQRIQDLESEFGVRLFERTSRIVALTPAGRQLLAPARNALQSLSSVTDLARSLAHGATGHAPVALAPNLGDIGARLIADLVAALPGLETVATSAWSADGLASLLSGDAVAAVVRGPVDHPALHSAVIGRYHDGYVAVSDQDPLSTADAIPLAAFQSRPVFITERSLAPVVHDRTVGYFAEHGVAPVWRHHRLLGYEQIAPFVAAGYAAMLIHSHLVDLNLAGIRILPVVEEAPAYEIRVAWRADDSAALPRLLTDLHPPEQSLPDRAGRSGGVRSRDALT